MRHLVVALLLAVGPHVQKYVRVAAPKVILEHVEVIDGTGAAPLPDRNVTIEGGKVSAIAPGADQPESAGTTVLRLRGFSVLPGIVGMHDHLYVNKLPNLAADSTFDRPAVRQEMAFSAPRLYLANGVTTARTAGSAEPYTDLKLAKDIDAGDIPGPHLEVTGPYMNERAREAVAYWAEQGVTSFKAYRNITRAELRGAIEEAHKRGLKVTGHLCSVTYPEAIELGIDNLEHGFLTDTELDPDKKPDTCSSSEGDYTLEHITPERSARLIADLVRHHVAITSTLVGSAASLDARPLRPAVTDAMSPSLREAYLYWRSRSPSPNAALLLRKEMELEREFVAAGGLLLAGPDSVGMAGNIPGFGDQRQIELLVEAGFKPVEAVRIATLNGATFLGRQVRIGSVAVGKNADLLVVKGDPAARIGDIENVEMVFKDGVGYDPKKLLEAVRGRYGEY